MVEKVLFLGQIFEMEVLMDLHVLRFSEFENHIFSSWPVCVISSVISITQKEITAETSNLVFNICITYRCNLKLFIKIGQELCVQGDTKEMKYVKAYAGNFVLVNFRIFRLR